MTRRYQRFPRDRMGFLACFFGIFLASDFGAPALAQALPSPPDTELIELQVGETRVLSQAGVTRVAVADSKVINAVAIDGREIILFGRNEGSSSVHLWAAKGKRKAYTVIVVSGDSKKMQRELDALLKRIPNARGTQVGDKLVIEGDDLSDDDRARIAALVERYPAALDFTGQVGWDRMVLLDVQVVEIPRSRLREFGLQWDSVSQGGVNTGVAWDARASSQLASRPGQTVMDAAWPASSAAGYFGVNALLSARIGALAQRGDVVMLAQPQLLARSGTTASFLAGGEVPYSTSDANGNPTTTFKPYGVSLHITPRIDRNGAIRSRIEVEASSVDASVTVPGGPALRTRRASTEFNVRSGQTLVIGGFLSREQVNDVSGLPLLGDIPVLGALFSSRRYQHKETELAIFVTPSIVSQDHPDLQQRVREGRSLLQETFPEQPRLGTSVPGPENAGWNPYHGDGSQWSPTTHPRVEP